MKDLKPSKPFSNATSRKFLGITKQDFIKYFFGGNATLAVIIIIAIVWFLIHNASTFFPQYQKKLNLYRISGQEILDFYAKENNAVAELSGLCVQAREYEIQDRLGALYRVIPIYSEFKAKSLKKIIGERKELKRAKTALSKIKIKPSVTNTEIKNAEDYLNNCKNSLKKAISAAVNKLDFSQVKNKSWPTDKKYLQPIRDAIVENVTTGKKPQFISDIEAQEAKKIAEIDALPFIQDLIKSKTAFNKPIPAMNTFVEELRIIADKTKAQGNKYNDVPNTKASLEKAISLAKTTEIKQEKQKELNRLYTIEPDYNTFIKPIYASKESYKIHHSALKEAIKSGFSTLPDTSKFQGKAAKAFIKDINDADPAQTLAELNAKVETWKHDEKYSMGQTVKGFFFGTEWTTNSSWQDFYGILPLLTGSVAVAIVALIIAVPFSVGGAIYVNRLASKAEQTFIKPFIEFIQAIPSIVLAFFGYVVLGALIQEYSQSWMFSWIPGFPVEDQYTILNAGLLLALMAVPTIFTLCEDALNNVPKAYNEASLALGATKLQTILKVILPSCASGVIAAILLGFGRIIGETMVVLLVLGGKISIPDSWTASAHSMTGILAQEIGEVNEGSLHWGALFMVALLLFSIALGINYVSQRILNNYSK